ncbi:MAG: M24 family metallopeptidase [Pyrobaculum sp.]
MIIATSTVNFAYLTGIWLETYERFKAAVKCGSRTIIVAPALEKIEGYTYRDGEDPAEALKKAIAHCGEEVAYVDENTTFLHLEVIRRALPPGVVVKMANFKDMRAVKREDEVTKIKTAAERIREVLNGLELREGTTERRAAAAIYAALYERGLRPGPVLVQFGVNTARPHQEPTDKRLQRGEAVVVDISAAHGGYYADLTASFWHGDPPEGYREILHVVKKAQEAALAAARPGARGSEVDKAAREAIERAGYGRYFIHRTGHGLGLEIHEKPDIAPNSSDVLTEGMVFTIEPGVYTPEFGVRLEVDVVMRKNGVEVL